MAMDIYQNVADTLLDMLDKHGTDWTKPWVANATGHHNAASKRCYSGMNVFLLATAQMRNGWTSHAWGTYGTWRKLGCTVQKGSKATWITQPVLRQYEKNGEEVKFYTFQGLAVFNLAQVDGDFTEATPEELEGIEDQLDAEAVIAATKASIRHAGDSAYYSPTDDAITLPPKGAFKSAEGYYGTAFHELVHWTGHSSRLKRDFSGRFGSEAYAFEELVAEAGAAMLSVDAGVTAEPREDHAKYLNSWIKVLKGDKKAAVDAFKLAARAAKFIREPQED